MIEKMEIRGVGLEIDEDLRKYVTKKIGRMDKYLPKHARKSAHFQVFLKERKIKTKKECTCEVVMTLPGEKIPVKESTINIYAAVDIVETKLKNILKKYKEKHTDKRVPRRLLNKIRSRKTL